MKQNYHIELRMATEEETKQLSNIPFNNQPVSCSVKHYNNGHKELTFFQHESLIKDVTIKQQII